MNASERKQRDWLLFLFILPLGIALLFCVGQLAIGITPNWEIQADMRSNLDPNSDFLTPQASGLIAPLDPNILTLPAWLNPLLNPNSTQPAIALNTAPPPVQPPTAGPTFASTLPAATSTNGVPPPPPPPNKTATSRPSADLAITKSDNSAIYTPGAGIAYQIVITNNGPNHAAGFNITDAVPAVINISTINCTANGTASCGTNLSSGNNVAFGGAALNAGAGNKLTITIGGTVSAGAAGNLVNAANIVIPGAAGFTDPALANNSATDTDTPVYAVDLSVTKDDGVATYTPGGTLTYTIVVTNNSAIAVSGATVNDPMPPQIQSWNWTCTEAGGAVCTTSGTSGINDSVNLPGGSSVTYTVNANLSGSASGNLVNTATVNVSSAYIDTNTTNNSAMDTDGAGVDLQITKSDGVASYTPGGTLTYTIVVTNNSAVAVSGATVIDAFPPQISSVNWNCTPAGSAACTASGTGNINDSVSLPAGGSVTYRVAANVSSYAAGTLENTASVTVPAGFTDIAPVNNQATDSDAPASSEPDIGAPDGASYYLAKPGSMTIIFSPAIIADGDVGMPDLVYYERIGNPSDPPASHIVALDWVKIEISSDGAQWYTVFHWENGTSSDTNTNVALSLVGDLCEIGGVPAETDNCIIPIARLYNSTGITIDVDSIVPAGNYPWMRLTSTGSEGADIDAIQPYYP